MILSGNKKTVFVLLCLGCITIAFNVAAITAVIPVISRDLGLSDISVSRIINYYMIPYGLGALMYAPLTKYFSYKKVIAVSMSLFAAACIVLGISKTINNILIARIIMGLSGASIIPLGLMIIGDSFEKATRGRLLGIFFSCNFFSSLVGIALGGIAYWRWLFYVPAFLSLVLVLLVVFVKTDILSKKHSGNINYMEALSNYRIRNIFIFIAVISALYFGVRQWLGVYLNDIYNLDKLTISYFFIFAAIGGFAGQLIGGIISDKKSRLFSCYIGFFMLAIIIIALSIKSYYLSAAFFMTLMTMGWTISHNGISAVLTDFPDENRHVIASLNSSVRFISGGIGFYISKFFVEKSFSLTFAVIGILMLFMIFFVKPIISFQK